ncbi:MAG: tRNA lysidine(34) synthetase TilS [Candidatus Competibacteraceae bacterium]|nr:tRNA lysidine(34) synthetase TilS [Candidatus Competibacteraceae bacterium]
MAVTPLSCAVLTSVLSAHPHCRRLIVGYSGGMDSHVLLHLLAAERARWPERGLEAIYVDHGLQAASAAWRAHAARVCRELEIAFRPRQIDARPSPGESPEAAARRARYAVFAAELDPETALLTGHHGDDQAETLLLQLLRGAGPHGLAAMPAAARLGRGWLLRPLLETRRAELLRYARRHQLHWIEDASNNNTDFDRNYLRHRILPLLEQRWPAVSRNLSRSARLCAESADWLDTAARSDLVTISTERSDALNIARLRQLSEPRQRNAVRYWLRQIGLPVPDSRQLRHLLHDILSARHDRQPCVRWPGGEARRYQHRLYAMLPPPAHDPRQTFSWQATATGWPPLDLPVGRLQMQRMIGKGLRLEALSDGSLTVRFRTGGERFQPIGRRHSQELKKLLQHAEIPPWQRDHLPLLYRDRHLVAVVGLGIAADQATGLSEAGWQPVLDSPSSVGSGIL